MDIVKAKENVYDKIKISERALSGFITAALMTLALVMTYGYFSGNSGSAAFFAETQKRDDSERVEEAFADEDSKQKTENESEDFDENLE